MKKTNTIVQEVNNYEIKAIIDNIAYIKSTTNKKSGLYNINKNEIVGNIDDYYTFMSTKFKLYYQEKKNKELSEENNCTERNIVSIYDAVTEQFIVDGWEVIKRFGTEYNIIVLKSPIDGKLHLFDRYAYRKSKNIFDKQLDDVEILYINNNCINDIYLVISINGKKGLYHHNCSNEVPSLETPIEFDNIEKLFNIIVYTKNNQKYFVGIGRYSKKSVNFDEIKFEDNNQNIAYCKKGDQIYVYNTKLQVLLFSTDADEIKYMYNNYNYYNGEFLFKIMKNGKYGVISSETTCEIRKSGTDAKVSTLLPPKYDEISKTKGGLYIKRNGKIGLFAGDSHNNQVIEPKYDKIDLLIAYNHRQYFALYTNGLCDIYKLSSPSQFTQIITPIITSCETVKKFDDVLDAFLYKKNGKYGLLFTNDDLNKIISPEYDNIRNVSEDSFIIEQNNKKGLIHFGEIKIPIEYDEITIGGKYDKCEKLKDTNVLYFALKKGKKYKLAKLKNLKYANNGVEYINSNTYDNIYFFREIMVVKNQTFLYIYDYNEKLLKSLPANTSVIAKKRPYENDYAKEHDYVDYYYCIDNVYYYYQDGNLIEVYTEINNLYSTTYETATNLFEIRSYNKDEHDYFCSTIDSQEDAEAENQLIEMSEKGISKIKYPTLVLKRVRKESN